MSKALDTSPANMKAVYKTARAYQKALGRTLTRLNGAMAREGRNANEILALFGDVAEIADSLRKCAEWLDPTA
jgi:hypothetical protein